MYHEQPHPSPRHAKPVRGRDKPQAPIDAIVRAAYRKFARSKTAREAMEQCLGEDSAKAKREVAP